MSEPSLYRSGVGIVLINQEGLVFLAQRKDNRTPPWQMPQGDVTPGERPEQAAMRELFEKLGIRRAKIIAGCPYWLHYEYPASSSRRTLQFRGQRHRWYLLQFEGKDRDIAFTDEHPSFQSWHWARPTEVVASVIAFKREVYGAVMQYFSPYLCESLQGAASIPSALISPGREIGRSVLLAEADQE